MMPAHRKKLAKDSSTESSQEDVGVGVAEKGEFEEQLKEKIHSTSERSEH